MTCRQRCVERGALTTFCLLSNALTVAQQQRQQCSPAQAGKQAIAAVQCQQAAVQRIYLFHLPTHQFIVVAGGRHVLCAVLRDQHLQRRIACRQTLPHCCAAAAPRLLSHVFLWEGRGDSQKDMNSNSLAAAAVGAAPGGSSQAGPDMLAGCLNARRIASTAQPEVLQRPQHT